VSNRLHELIEMMLDGELGAEERRELEVYRESNVAARRQIEQAEAHLESVALEPSGDSAVVPEGDGSGQVRSAKTPMGIRILAGVLLLAILFGFAMLPFVRFKASMMEVQRGDVLSVAGNPLRVLRDDGEARVPAGAVAELEIRGRSRMLVTGPARLLFTEKGPAARIEVAAGAVELERMEGHRECFVAIGDVELEPAATGGAIKVVRLAEGSKAGTATVISGSTRVFVGGKTLTGDGVGADGVVSGAGTVIRIDDAGRVTVVPGTSAASTSGDAAQPKTKASETLP